MGSNNNYSKHFTGDGCDSFFDKSDASIVEQEASKMAETQDISQLVSNRWNWDLVSLYCFYFADS